MKLVINTYYGGFQLSPMSGALNMNLNLVLKQKKHRMISG